MFRWLKRARTLRRAEEAATLVEYTLMMMLIAASCFVALSSLGSFVGDLFRQLIDGFAQ